MSAFVSLITLDPTGGGWNVRRSPFRSSHTGRSPCRAQRIKKPVTYQRHLLSMEAGGIDECISWLTANSGKVNNVLNFSRMDTRSNRGVCISTGSKVLERTELVSLPEGTYIGVKEAKKLLDEAYPGLSSCGVVGEAGDFLALALLLERSKGSDSFFAPFLKTFPEQNNLDCLPVWNNEEHEMLRGSAVHTDVMNWLENTKEEWAALDGRIFQKGRHAFPEEHFSLKAYRWALCLTSSRGLYVSQSEPTVLAPILNLFSPVKPDSTQTARLEINGGVFFAKKKLTLKANRDMNDREFVTVSYRRSMRNAELAFAKGLTIDDSRYNSFFLSFQISSLDRFYDDKRDVLEASDVETNPKFEIVGGSKSGEYEAPDDMDSFLRLLCLTGADAFLLEGVFRGEVWDFMALPVSADNEMAMCELVINACADLLDEYSDDLKGMETAKMSERQKMARQIIEGEKEILQDVQRAYQRRLDSLDGLEYYAERRLKMLDLLRPIDENEIVDSESGGRVARAFDENY
ncbi:unnamed protein product [Agarophyton chilense]